jgi:Na+:H+ antiporter, NhaA family
MIRRVKKVFELEASTGIFLLIATIAALWVANSEGFTLYQNFFAINLPINFDVVGIHKNMTVRDWINDGLMAIFFLLVGLELKEEVLAGELSSKERAMLPAIAAVGGVVVPALIFLMFNFDHKENLKGFAIPTATDIAFAYGVICVFGKKISKSLRVFLISLAIFDDLAAILIIAIFYSQGLSLFYLLLSFVVFAGLAALNFRNSTTVSFYLLLGAALWLMVLKSGIHPTVAGVVLAMFVPHEKNTLKNLIKKIAPAVNFIVLPIFAFANSGVRIADFSLDVMSQPLVLGIICGLFFGKQIGIMLFSFIAIKLKITHLPRSLTGKEVSWFEFYGVVILTGIGFTMSFFIGSLAFSNNPILFDEVKIAVLVASFLAAVFGMAIINFSLSKSKL